MMVARERFGNALILHHNKRNAVGYGPILIGPRCKEIQPALQESGIQRDHARAGTTATPLQ